MASETGVLPFRPKRSKPRPLAARQNAACRFGTRRLVPDKEIKKQLSSRQPLPKAGRKSDYARLSSEPTRMQVSDHGTVVARQRCFGYTDEDLRLLITPMASEVKRPSAPWALIRRLLVFPTNRNLCFITSTALAQVTNPPSIPFARVGHVFDQLHRRRRQHSQRSARNCHTLKCRIPFSRSGTGKAAPRLTR